MDTTVNYSQALNIINKHIEDIPIKCPISIYFAQSTISLKADNHKIPIVINYIDNGPSDIEYIGTPADWINKINTPLSHDDVIDRHQGKLMTIDAIVPYRIGGQSDNMQPLNRQALTNNLRMYHHNSTALNAYHHDNECPIRQAILIPNPTIADCWIEFYE